MWASRMSIVAVTVLALDVAAASDSVDLLQMTEQESATTLPATDDVVGSSTEVAALLAKPESVFMDISSKVSALEKDLAEMKQRNEMNLASQAKMFKKLLEEQTANNTLIARANADIKADIDSLSRGNAEKRQKAKDLTKATGDLTNKLQHARQLIETTNEFVGRSLSEYSDNSNDELDVLAELDSKDAEKRTYAEHADRLRQVESSVKNIGMLQVGASHSVPVAATPGAEGLVKGLGAGLTEFAQRAQEGESELKARFAATYKVGADKRTALLEESKSLKEKRGVLQVLDQRLSAAVVHLEQKRAQLEEALMSVQGFAVKHLGHIDASDGA